MAYFHTKVDGYWLFVYILTWFPALICWITIVVFFYTLSIPVELTRPVFASPAVNLSKRKRKLSSIYCTLFQLQYKYHIVSLSKESSQLYCGLLVCSIIILWESNAGSVCIPWWHRWTYFRYRLAIFSTFRPSKIYVHYFNFQW